MDKPLKFFLGVSTGFLLFIVIIIIALLVKDPNSLAMTSNENGRDSLYAKAETMAMETLDTLLKIYPDYQSNSFVKFTIVDNKGAERVVWGSITELERDHVSVIILEKFDIDNSLPESFDLSIGQIEDWIVEVGEGKIRGGYTSQALLIMERQQEQANKTLLDSQLQLFVDPIE